MDKTLCGVSALRYYRVPPRYLYALPCLPDFDTPYGRGQIRESYLAADVLGLPLNALELGGRRLHSSMVAPRFWSSDLPAGAIVDTPFDYAVTSPVLTLLMVSPYVSIVHLALLIYEFVGTFTVFAPSPELEEIYREAIGGIRRISLDDWHRVACDVIAKERGIAADRSGSAAGSDLWSRPALLTLDELDAFIEANAGMHGIKNLALARRYVTGVTASPFEARASVLLASSRALGGAGFTGVRNNVRIDLDADARKICGSSYVKGDLVWSARAGRPLTILECQGAMVHGGWGAAAADDDRALAVNLYCKNGNSFTWCFRKARCSHTWRSSKTMGKVGKIAWKRALWIVCPRRAVEETGPPPNHRLRLERAPVRGGPWLDRGGPARVDRYSRLP